MMDEKETKFLANVLILYFLFDVSAEDIRDNLGMSDDGISSVEILLDDKEVDKRLSECLKK